MGDISHSEYISYIFSLLQVEDSETLLVTENLPRNQDTVEILYSKNRKDSVYTESQWKLPKTNVTVRNVASYFEACTRYFNLLFQIKLNIISQLLGEKITQEINDLLH